MSEFPDPIPWKKYGLVCLALLVLNLLAYALFHARTDVWLSVLTFTLIYVVIWFCIKLFDTEKSYRRRHAANALSYHLTTMLEVVLLVVGIYVYFYFSLGRREPLHAFASFLREKLASSWLMALTFTGLLLCFVAYLVYEFFNDEEAA